MQVRVNKNNTHYAFDAVLLNKNKACFIITGMMGLCRYLS